MDGHRSARAGYRIPLIGQLTVTLRLSCGNVACTAATESQKRSSTQCRNWLLGQRSGAARPCVERRMLSARRPCQYPRSSGWVRLRRDTCTGHRRLRSPPRRSEWSATACRNIPDCWQRKRKRKLSDGCCEHSCHHRISVGERTSQLRTFGERIRVERQDLGVTRNIRYDLIGRRQIREVVGGTGRWQYKRAAGNGCSGRRFTRRRRRGLDNCARRERCRSEARGLDNCARRGRCRSARRSTASG